MTVKELIEELEKVENKDLKIGAGFGRDYWTDDIEVVVWTESNFVELR